MHSNDLLLTIEEFSQRACLDGHLFNVRTACDKCDSDVNNCLRVTALEKLLEVQTLAENRVGYNFTKRYHKKTIYWTGNARRLQLDWPGVTRLNVREHSEFVESAPVSPFVAEDITVQLIGDICVASVPAAYVDNPNHAVFRDDLSGGRILPQPVNGYPRLVNGMWEVVLDKMGDPCLQTINLQHCRMIAVVGPAACLEGEIKACYPGTDTVIPYSKPPELVGTDMVYWFWAWSLINPAFVDEDTDLGGGDLYKLLAEIDFRCFTEVEVFPEVLFDDDCCGPFTSLDETVAVAILDETNSIIDVGRFVGNACQPGPGFLTVYYRTDPDVANVEDQLPGMKDAIAHLVAAELPMEACGCLVTNDPTSFIAKAQTAYSKVIINPLSGQMFENQQYGELYGQKVFANRIQRAKKWHRIIR